MTDNPIAVIGDTCDQAHHFTEVQFIGKEIRGRRWMIIIVGMECCCKEFYYSTDEIRDLRDRLSEWLGDKHEVRALRQDNGHGLLRGNLRSAVP